MKEYESQYPVWSNEWYYDQIVQDRKANPDNPTFTISHVPLRQRRAVSDLLLKGFGGNEGDKKLAEGARTIATAAPIAVAANFPVVQSMLYNAAVNPVTRAAWKVLNAPIVQTGFTIDGLRNAASGNGVQKTVREFSNGNYWNGTKSAIGDILDLFGGYKIASRFLKKIPIRSIFNSVNAPESLDKANKLHINTSTLNRSNTSNKDSDVVEMFLSYDYPKGESLLAKRLESGATDRVDWLRGYDGKKLAEYIRKYIPYETSSLTDNYSQSRWGKDIILSNRNLPRKYYNSKSVGSYGRDLNELDELPLSKEELADVFDHEILHDIQAKILDWRKIDPDINNIFSKEFLTKRGGVNFRRNGTMVTDEITPRITQIKNFLGISDGKKLLTGEELKEGIRKYIENRFDNDLKYLYDNVKDWDRFAKWVNKTVPVITGGIMLNEYGKFNN